MYNQINELEEQLRTGEALPDLKRLYLHDKILYERDPEQKEVLNALLDGYDRGLIEIRIDFWDGTVKYSRAMVN